MIAEVIINSNVKNLNRTFDYKIPVELENEISIGSRILLPFGGKKQLEEGYVVGIKESSEYIEKLKEISKVEEKNAISPENIQLAKYMANRYFCNISDCINLMLPPGTTTKKFENRINDKLQNFVYLAKDRDEIQKEIEEKHLLDDSKAVFEEVGGSSLTTAQLCKDIWASEKTFAWQIHKSLYDAARDLDMNTELGEIARLAQRCQKDQNLEKCKKVE